MGTGTKALISAVALAALAVGAMIGLGIADEPAPAAASDISEWDVIRPAMGPVGAAAGGSRGLRSVAEGAGKRGRPHRPEITDLITTGPVTVDADGGRIAVLSCGKSQGIALDGGVITPSAPAQVVVTVLSRANPNPPFANSRRNYYVGVRNLGDAPATFRGTLVCAKGIGVG